MSVERALALAEHARGRTKPNPWVGAVVVADGDIVGEGWTEPPPGRHAEIVALDAAGGRARGATLYVTLEPCSHQGRTPPCAEALIAAGVGRVVAAMEDPNPRVAGEGFRKLRDAGIEIALMREFTSEAAKLNEASVAVVGSAGWFVIEVPGGVVSGGVVSGAALSA